VKFCETAVTEAANTDEAFYERAVRRIYINMVWLSAAGAVAAAWRAGWPWAAGLLIGAAASAVNFRWLHQFANAIGPGRRPSNKRLGLFLSLRYLIFGAVAYVIVKYLKVNLMAALVGLFAAVAAVLLEMLYELIYART
jgi:hypothetical protein